MPPTKGLPITSHELIENCDQYLLCCMMEQLAEFAMYDALAALILARFTQPVWPHSVTDCLMSTHVVTYAPAVQRPAPARGSC